jgi:hypothetical protein
VKASSGCAAGLQTWGQCIELELTGRHEVWRDGEKNRSHECDERY